MTDPVVSLNLQDLIDCRWHVASAGLPWQRGLTGIPGLLTTRRRGQGLEFDDLRQYLEGDDIRHIDWQVTARSGKPHVRLFREERERTVTVVLDLSPSMFTGTRRLRAVTAALAAAHVLWQAAASGARTAVVIGDGNRLDMTRPASGERGALAGCAKIAEQFATASAAATSNQTARPLDGLLEWIVNAGHETGLLLLISALDDPGAQWQAKFADAGRRDRLALLWVRDPTEVDGLPAGFYRYRNARTGKADEIYLTNRQSAQMAATLNEQREELVRQCESWRVPCALITDADQRAVTQALRVAGI